jgi:hypothetical protein
MKCKTIGIVVTIVVFFAGIYIGDKVASTRMRAETAKLKGDVEIYKAEADKYAQTLRDIRQTAAQATVTEKAI